MILKWIILLYYKSKLFFQLFSISTFSEYKEIFINNVFYWWDQCMKVYLFLPLPKYSIYHLCWCLCHMYTRDLDLFVYPRVRQVNFLVCVILENLKSIYNTKLSPTITFIISKFKQYFQHLQELPNLTDTTKTKIFSNLKSVCDLVL